MWIAGSQTIQNSFELMNDVSTTVTRVAGTIGPVEWSRVRSKIWTLESREQVQCHILICALRKNRWTPRLPATWSYQVPPSGMIHHLRERNFDKKYLPSQLQARNPVYSFHSELSAWSQTIYPSSYKLDPTKVLRLVPRFIFWPASGSHGRSGKEKKWPCFLLVCASLEWYRCPSPYLKLYNLGPDAPEHISSMVMDGNAVWVASSIYAIKYIRGKEVRRYFSTWRLNFTVC